MTTHRQKYTFKSTGNPHQVCQWSHTQSIRLQMKISESLRETSDDALKVKEKGQEMLVKAKAQAERVWKIRSCLLVLSCRQIAGSAHFMATSTA
jgi:hypothetical protein